MAEITYQMVLSTLQTAGLLIGISYYILTLRNQQKNQKHAKETRRTQLFLQLYGTATPEMVKRGREIPSGIKMRSTFPQPSNPPEWLAKGLPLHCHEEMQNLSKFLPELYARR